MPDRRLAGHLLDIALGCSLSVVAARLHRPSAIDLADLSRFAAAYSVFWLLSYAVHHATSRAREPRVLIVLLCSVAASVLTQVVVAPLLLPLMRGPVATAATALLPAALCALRLRVLREELALRRVTAWFTPIRWPLTWLTACAVAALLWMTATGSFVQYRLWAIERLDRPAHRYWALEPLIAGSLEQPTWVLADPLVPGEAYVLERQGVVKRISLAQPERAAQVVLDIRERVGATYSENGLVGAALHPRLAAGEAYLYLWYTSATPASAPGQLDLLARFRFDSATRTFDPASELRLIEQRDRDPAHNGGGLLFGQDGMLYIGVGDEGAGSDELGNAQRIDHNLFAALLRIDVDRDPARSHPPPRQPADGSTRDYFIPNDNPFVGVPNALEELWAIGLRNPYRIALHERGILVADVGQETYEEINLATRGSNHGWSYREGALPFLTSRRAGVRPNPLHGKETDPVLSYPHVGRGVVIGGVVYAGTRFPELTGRYLYADFNSGELFALTAEMHAHELLARLPEHPGLGVSCVTQVGDDVVVSVMGSPNKREGSLLRLTRTDAPPPTPRTRSAEQSFAQLCSTCHGPAGRPPAGATLAARDLTDAHWQRSATDARIAEVITKGGAATGLSAGMPAWLGMLSEPEITALVAHVRSLAAPEAADAGARDAQ